MKRKILAIVISAFITTALITTTVVLIIKNNQRETELGWKFPTNTTFEGNYGKITYMVEMDDGIALATNIYIPKNITSPLPTILARTPYNKDQISVLSSYTESGYCVVIQDTRGFYDSEGEKGLPFLQDSKDGKETVKWIEKQPWSNKKIGTWGPSALAITQYLLAPNAPESLKCQIPLVGTPDGYSAAFRGGSLRYELFIPWMEAQGYSDEIINKLADLEKLNETWESGRIINRYGEIHTPAMHIGGWYDIFTKGTVDAFTGYQTRGGEGARGKSKLVMGPWTHGGAFGAPSGEYNGIDYVYPNQNFGMVLSLTDAVFEKWLQENETMWDNLPNVLFYVMSSLPYNPDRLANQWYASEIWPLDFEEMGLYLFSNQSLLFAQNLEEDSSKSFLFDPLNPVPTIGGGNLLLDAGTYNQTQLEEREDVLAFSTPVLEEPLTIVGKINITLEVSSNCTDTDFTVKLTDVFPDGSSMLITDTILRARNRFGADKWEFMDIEEKYKLNITLDPTAYLFNEGHRLRIDISSSNYPRFEVNPNTGDPLWKNETSYIANNTIHMSGSSVSLPVVNLEELTSFDYEEFLDSLKKKKSRDVDSIETKRLKKSLNEQRKKFDVFTTYKEALVIKIKE